MDTLDPTIVALTRAIKKNETGTGDTYNLPPGKDGEKGAYQFLPSTWSAWAGEHLGDSNAPMTMENQNKVAYAQVKKFKDAGYNPGQIASLWNSGKSDPTGNVGTSKGGAKYDTPAYVNKVYQDYQTFKGETPTTQPSTPELKLDTTTGLPTTDTTTQTPLEQPKEPGILSQSLSQFGKGYQQITQGANSNNIGEGLLNIGKGVLNEAAGGLRAVFSPIEWATKMIAKIPGISDAFGGVDKGVNFLADKISESPALQKFAVENPDAEEVISNLISIGTSIALSKVGGKVKEGVSPITSVIKEKIGGESELNAIQQKIMPKSTVGEARIALKEGRLVPGKEPGVIISGSKGEILPSEKVIRASKTIKEQIPNASKMDDQKLFTSLDNKIGEISQKIRPDMENVKITSEDLGKLNDDINTIHSKQLELADASEESNLTKRQTAFKTRISNIKEDSTLADVWDERIDYDNSIPSNVKKATSQSPETLQNKKSEWLENRSLYNDLIHMKAEESGIATKKAFSDMSDMFNAQSGLLSDVKSNLMKKPSKLRQWIKKNPIKAALIGAGVASQLPGVGKVAGTVIGL